MDKIKIKPGVRQGNQFSVEFRSLQLKFLRMNFLFVAIFFAFTQAQDLSVYCKFSMTSNGYTCQIKDVMITDNENYDIEIAGLHLPGMSNEDVQMVEISCSTVPFVITQLFTTFRYLYFFKITKDSGLARIQTDAFQNATHLEFVFITGLSRLRLIDARAFTGGAKIMSLDLILNRIETIHETAFYGLESLRFLYLDGNRITQLPANLFLTCNQLEILQAPVNFLETLDGGLLRNNSKIQIIDFNKNSIEAIGSEFFDGMNRLTTFRFESNRCADSSWTFTGKVTIDTVRECLSSCFDNADDKLKRFLLEVRGSVVLRNEDGSELIRI